MNYYAFGDSLTDVTGQSVNGYISQLNTQIGNAVITNKAVGGSMVNDQLPKVYSVNTAVGDVSTIMLGVNDERIYGSNATKQAYFRDGLATAVAWLALANKQTARSVGGETGSWSNTGIDGIGRATSTLNSTKTFTVSGTTVYIAVVLADSAGFNGTYSITIDGGTPMNFDSNAPGVTSYLNNPYTDRLHRFSGLSSGNHTVMFKLTGATYGYVQWAAGNAQTVFPAVCVGNIIRQSNTSGIGYSEWGGSDTNVSAYNSDIAALVANFQADGLNVSLVDVNSVLNNTTDLTSVDGLHPNQSGQDKLFSTFYPFVSSAWTFSPVSAYLRSISGISDGTYWIGSAPNRTKI